RPTSKSWSATSSARAADGDEGPVGAVSIYLELTRDFNQGRLRAVVASGQAVVLHRLAIMSKDGDWILREEAETTAHVRQVRARRMPDPPPQRLYSRVARDLIRPAAEFPEDVRTLAARRPLLALAEGSRDELERALDAERRSLMRANEERLSRFEEAARGWA